MSETTLNPPLPPHLQTPEERREFIFGLEEAIASQGNALFDDNFLMPLTHKFCDGMYVREIFIPAGMLLIGKIHKHEHPNFLLMGTVSMITEDGGVVHMSAPQSLISPAGCKRAIYTHTDVRWVTVHLNSENLDSVPMLEEKIIAKTYGDFEKFLEEKKCLSH